MEVWKDFEYLQELELQKNGKVNKLHKINNVKLMEKKVFYAWYNKFHLFIAFVYKIKTKQKLRDAGGHITSCHIPINSPIRKNKQKILIECLSTMIQKYRRSPAVLDETINMYPFLVHRI